MLFLYYVFIDAVSPIPSSRIKLNNIDVVEHNVLIVLNIKDYE